MYLWFIPHHPRVFYHISHFSTTSIFYLGEVLVEKYEVKIPILQRDYAQGRENNISLCENFLKALKESVLQDKIINLDFIYGNLDNGTFLPLDGQQRLTTLFLLHWYAAEKEHIAGDCREILKKFSYETRLSSRRFC